MAQVSEEIFHFGSSSIEIIFLFDIHENLICLKKQFNSNAPPITDDHISILFPLHPTPLNISDLVAFKLCHHVAVKKEKTSFLCYEFSGQSL